MATVPGGTSGVQALRYDAAMTRPPIPDPPHEGGCLCGAVRYAYNARPLGMNACHCKDCKKLSGSAHLSVVLGDRTAFTHAGETTRWRRRGDSGRFIDIVRCAACGVRMWHEPVDAPQYVFIQAGTLDDTSWFSPASHIYTGSAAPFVHFEPDTLQLPGPPESRDVVLAAFKRLYPD